MLSFTSGIELLLLLLECDYNTYNDIIILYMYMYMYYMYMYQLRYIILYVLVVEILEF